MRHSRNPCVTLCFCDGFAYFNSEFLAQIDKARDMLLGLIVSLQCFLFLQEQYDLFVNKGTERLCEEYGIKFLGRLPLDRV